MQESISVERKPIVENPEIDAGAHIEAAAAQLRTLDAMLDAMRNKPAPAPDPVPQTTSRALLPGMAKLHAEGPTAEKPRHLHADVQALAPVILVGPNFAGATDVDGDDPPDLHGAIGLDHFVEVSNAHVDIFVRTDPAKRTSIPLADFFGVRRNLFQARSVYDSIWNRWVITAEALGPDSRQLFYIAISTTSNALGSYFIYELDVAFHPGDRWFLPQPGMDQDAIIITADLIGSYAESNAVMFAIAKARLYNGLGFSVPVFTGLRLGITPPIVLDQNGNTFLIAASPPSGNRLSLYTLTNSSRPNATQLSGPVNIAVPEYAAPPNAPQPGTSYFLPTLDSRFISASTQTGHFLWQVHTIDFLGYAAPKFYQINTATNTVVQSAFFYATRTSYDFNASIAANSNNDIFVTWSMTDPARGTNPQVRYAGFDRNTGSTVALGPGAAAYTSPTYKEFNAWGYTSAVTIDPRNPRRAWLVNEDVQRNHDWGSRIAGIGFA
jgi:hypothetical protein